MKYPAEPKPVWLSGKKYPAERMGLDEVEGLLSQGQFIYSWPKQGISKQSGPKNLRQEVKSDWPTVLR